MTKLCIPKHVLDSIEGVSCEFLRPVELLEPDSAEQFCYQWVHTHLEIEVDSLRIQELEQAGLSAFEAMRRAAVELAAETWVRIHDGPDIKATPSPEHATSQ